MTNHETSPREIPGARSTPPSAIPKGTTNRRSDLADYWRRRPWQNHQCCSEDCRCNCRNKPSQKRIDAYRDAVEHLARHNLGAAALTAECRALWRNGGADRDLAESVVRRWTT